MSEASPDKPFAWQPLTPRGVAAFAGASLGRLLLVQLLIAMLAAGTIVWFLSADWVPVVTAAIGQLPAQGQIRAGRLEWPGASPARLAEDRFVSLAVDLKHEGEARSPAHVQIEFGETDCKIISLLGFVQRAYPRGWTIAFNGPTLKPWWGAWSPALLALAFGALVLSLLAIWAVLATGYCGLAWLVGFFANRALCLRASWRLAGAALMPGAVLFTATIILYGLGGLDLVQLLAAAGVHFVVGWVYVLVSPLWVPRIPPSMPVGNPFKPGSAPEPKA